MDVLTDTLRFLASTVPVMAAAMYLVSFTINRGVMERLAERIRCRLKFLDEVAVTSIATCFVSPTAAYSILSQAFREGKVDEREVIAVSFLNSFPAALSHIYAFFLPFVIPLLGWAGVVYTALRLLNSLIKSALGLALAIRWGKRGTPPKLKVRRARVSASRNLMRVIPMLAVTYAAVSYLSSLGFFKAITKALNFLPVDPNVLTLSIMESVNMRVAIILASGMLRKGILSPKMVVVGLILGNVLTFSTRFVRHSLPLHVSLFGRLGVKIVLLNALITLAIDALIILILLSLPCL